jgi:hypothetical protein
MHLVGVRFTTRLVALTRPRRWHGSRGAHWRCAFSSAAIDDDRPSIAPLDVCFFGSDNVALASLRQIVSNKGLCGGSGVCCV